MKTKILFFALLACAVAASAQPKTSAKLVNGLPFPLVAPSELDKSLRDKTLSFKLRDVTLLEALQDLEQQSGITLRFGWNSDSSLRSRLSLDTVAFSYTGALRAILDQAGVAAKFERFSYEREWTLTFEDSAAGPGAPRSGEGPFQLRVRDFYLMRTQGVKWTKEGEPLRLHSSRAGIFFSFMPDPWLPLLGQQIMRLTRAADENGKSWLSTNGQTVGNLRDGYSVGRMSGETLNFLPAPEGIQKLAHLEGTVIYVVPTTREKWEVPDVFRAREPAHTFKSNGLPIGLKILEVSRQEKSVVLVLRVDLKDINKWDTLGFYVGRSLQTDYVKNFVRLEGANGLLMLCKNAGYVGGTDSADITLTFVVRPERPPQFMMQNGRVAPAPQPNGATLFEPPLAAPLKFVLDLPTEWVQTQVPFSFTDLPLP